MGGWGGLRRCGAGVFVERHAVGSGGGRDCWLVCVWARFGVLVEVVLLLEGGNVFRFK